MLCNFVTYTQVCVKQRIGKLISSAMSADVGDENIMDSKFVSRLPLHWALVEVILKQHCNRVELCTVLHEVSLC